MNTSQNKNYVAAAAVLGMCIIIAFSVGAYVFYRVRAMDNTLSVTGSATQSVRADSAKWTLTVNRPAIEENVAAVQGRVSRDIQTVTKFFIDGGISADKIQVTPVSVNIDWSREAGAPRSYTVQQQITVSSDDTALIDRLSQDIGSLAARGLLVSANQPEYYVSSLPEIRVALIGKAVEDAKARAQSIAESTGQKVGALKSASSGVVQVMAPQSVDIADYGSYDTSTVDKTVMVTARAVFYLR